jgi:hypothetical protein
VTFGGHYVVLVGLLVLLAACRWSGRIPEMPGTRHVLGVVGLAVLGAAAAAGLLFASFWALIGWGRNAVAEAEVPDERHERVADADREDLGKVLGRRPEDIA